MIRTFLPTPLRFAAASLAVAALPAPAAAARLAAHHRAISASVSASPAAIAARFMDDYQHMRLAAMQAYVADGYVLDLPFGPAGQNHLEGKAMGAAYLRSAFAKYKAIVLRNVVITPAADGRTAVVEARARFTTPADVSHEVGYVWVLTVVAGKLTGARTYLIPVEN